MPAVILSAIPFDPAGHARINALATSDMAGASRRLNRVQTLDGGVAINDGGYTPADATWTIRWRPDGSTEFDAVSRMVRLYARLRVITESGVFTAAPESIGLRNGEATLTLLILEQLT